MALPKIIADAVLKERLDAQTAPKVTKEYMESRISAHEFHRLGGTVTVCNLVLDNGYSVRGESACVSLANFNREIGEKIAYENAFSKLWPLFGFALAEKLYQETKE
jgi:hypothetical protein